MTNPAPTPPAAQHLHGAMTTTPTMASNLRHVSELARIRASVVEAYTLLTEAEGALKNMHPGETSSWPQATEAKERAEGLLRSLSLVINLLAPDPPGEAR